PQPPVLDETYLVAIDRRGIAVLNDQRQRPHCRAEQPSVAEEGAGLAEGDGKAVLRAGGDGGSPGERLRATRTVDAMEIERKRCSKLVAEQQLELAAAFDPYRGRRALQ